MRTEQILVHFGAKLDTIILFEKNNKQVEVFMTKY